MYSAGGSREGCGNISENIPIFIKNVKISFFSLKNVKISNCFFSWIVNQFYRFKVLITVCEGSHHQLVKWFECLCTLQVLHVDPEKDATWKTLKNHLKTDEVHAEDRLNPNVETPGTFFRTIFTASVYYFLTYPTNGIQNF